MRKIKDFILFETDLCEIIVYIIILGILIGYYQTIE